jgi:hypothetical protein
MGDAFFRAFVPAAAKVPIGSLSTGDRGPMLTIIKASLLGSALILLEGSASLASYQTPCVQGHVCECVRYTTVNRSWVDCRSYGRVKYGRVKSRAY